MAPKYDSNAVGSSRVVDGQVWYVVAVYPIHVINPAVTTGTER